ncbi:cytochrome P450-dit2 [Rhizopus stolonifer]|uniref:Cytochrome P450-dit2 n=1 Tax=Rhizopus stolonifer TaxID=4846 RepID=A0A367KNC0_RHIST|nr:cytochrome P450-dit2 [Rhizopus stolonifer]
MESTYFTRAGIGCICCVFSALAGSALYRKLIHIFFAPRALRHIPKVNTFQWFWSILIGESHDVRVKKLVLPIMNQHGLCLKYIMGHWSLTVADPQYLQVLLKDMETFPKIQMAMDPDLILTNQAPSMSNSSMHDWRRQRKVANPAFQQPMPIETFGNIVLNIFKTIEQNQPDGVIDAVDYMKRYALDGLGSGILGLDMGAISDANSHYSNLYKEAFSIVRDPLVYLFPAYTRIPSRWIPYRNRARLANERLRTIFYTVLKEKKKQKPEKNADLLSLMVEANRGGLDMAYLTDGELIANLSTFFVAGHETTASATASFLYYLAVNPDIQEKARQEVVSILGDDLEDVLPTEKELKQMTFLNYCIKETMRINPPTSGNLPRTTSKDTYIENYWDKPQDFIPERFDPTHESYRENAVWMPFGYGPRTCVGVNFSLSEQRVLHAMLLRKFTWSLVPNSEHQKGLKNANGGGIGLLGPESLKIQLTKRHHQ